MQQNLAVFLFYGGDVIFLSSTLPPLARTNWGGSFTAAAISLGAKLSLGPQKVVVVDFLILIIKTNINIIYFVYNKIFNACIFNAFNETMIYSLLQENNSTKLYLIRVNTRIKIPWNITFAI